MKEAILKSFFEGQIDAKDLSADISDSVEIAGDVIRVRIEGMEDPFEVRSDHLIRLCDAVLSDQVEPKDLETISFCIIASDAFEYDTNTEDGELVGETCFDWSTPEINYLLHKKNVKLFRNRLLGKDVELEAHP